MLWVCWIITAIVWAWVIFTPNRSSSAVMASPLFVLFAKALLALMVTLIVWLVYFVWN